MSAPFSSRQILACGIVFLACGSGVSAEWSQDAHDGGRTGATAESPDLPWTFLWTWNGSDAQGGLGGRRYQASAEARPVTGGEYVYVPAGAVNGEGYGGLYALRKCNGTVAWQSTVTAFNAPPAYHAAGVLFAGGANGLLYQFDAATGQVLGTYTAGGPLNKSILLAGDFVYVVTDGGQLHKVSAATMAPAWTYAAGSSVATPPAHSAASSIVVFCTDDLYVHGVNDADGTRSWRVKPSPNTPGGPPEYFNSFEFSWPVIADSHGLVLVRQTTMNYHDLWGPGPMGRYPDTNAAIRDYLIANPSKKNLFALDLENGSERFVPAVGTAYLETYSSGGVVGGIVGCPPVVRTYPDGTEVAYELWRCGQTTSGGAPVDGRWDSQVGEMVLDGQTIPGLAAGDLRRVQWVDDFVITDEQGPLVMAGDTLLYGHWAFCEHRRLIDRSPSLGLDTNWNNPIQVQPLPSMVRWIAGQGTPDVQTHWYPGSMLEMFGDPRVQPGPGWWGYWNVWGPDPSFGPRYTLVSDGLVIVSGGGGDLFVFAHSGSGPAPAILTPPADATVSAGQVAVFSVAASGTGRSYQWRRNGVPLVDGPRISGSTMAVLTISNCLPADAGAYAVEVSNACGTVIGGPAVLTVTGGLLGDADLDGDVDLMDVARLQSCFGAVPAGDCSVCDWTSDGVIDFADATVQANHTNGPQ